MVSIISLWLPILLSAVFVFMVSFVIHMLLTYHRSDYTQVPGEDEVMESLGKVGIPPGNYMIPYAGDMKVMRSPEFIEKMKKGPVAFLIVAKCGNRGMGGSLALWFIYSIIVSIFAGYVAGSALGPGASFAAVFRFTGTVAFVGYSLALLHYSIWYQIKWSTTFKSIFDGLIYALVTAAVFGWLWPTVI